MRLRDLAEHQANEAVRRFEWEDRKRHLGLADEE